LHTCSAGSQAAGALGVSHPTVHEYLSSCNNNLLINIPEDDKYDEFEEENVFYV
jgi:hypothetical protein